MYLAEQIEFLESIMEMLALSGYKPKLELDGTDKDAEPLIQIKLKEMNNVKLWIFANPENFSMFNMSAVTSKKLEVRYADHADEHDSHVRFMGDLGLIEGWETLTNYSEFVDHQHEGGFGHDYDPIVYGSDRWKLKQASIKQLESLNPAPTLGQVLKSRREVKYVLD